MGCRNSSTVLGYFIHSLVISVLSTCRGFKERRDIHAQLLHWLLSRVILHWFLGPGNQLRSVTTRWRASPKLEIRLASQAFAASHSCGAELPGSEILRKRC